MGFMFPRRRRRTSQICRILIYASIFAPILWVLYLYSHCSPYICEPDDHWVKFDAYNSYQVGDHLPTGKGRHRDHKNGKALVVASLKEDDTSWLTEELPDWEHYIYVMDDPTADLHVAKNKGRESMAYLTYIIDHYHDLPDYMVFLHGRRYQWHNEDPMYDGVPMIQRLQTKFVNKAGYTNMRCTWELGCPAQVHPFKQITRLEAFLEPNNDRANTEAVYAHAFQELFPNIPVPSTVGVPAGGQFALARWKVLQFPRSYFQRVRQWLKNTKLPDSVSGRIMEYSWHILLGMPTTYCLYASPCFCEQYGLCNMTCTNGACEGRYKLPPKAQLPTNWPDRKPGPDGLPHFGWLG